jgi:hypothetical protein
MVRIAFVVIVIAAVAWVLIRLHGHGKTAGKAATAKDIVDTEVEAANAGKRDDPLA